MIHFILRRVLHSSLLLIGVSVLSFSLVDLAPGDFYESMRVNPAISPATLAALRAQHGLNRSFPVRYLHWIRSALEGDWGFSLTYNAPAGPILWSRSGNTLMLTATATLLAWIIAVPLGTWAAAHPKSWVDRSTSATVSALVAMPELVLALLLLLFAVRTGHFPVGGMTSLGVSESAFNLTYVWRRLDDVGRHLLLPSICLAAGLLPSLLSHMRAAMYESLQSPFIAAARGYGIPFGRLLFRHALPAAANPLISLWGLSFGMLMSSSLLVEVIFGWPGLGQLIVDAILQRDLFLVVDAVILSTAFLVAGNLLADILLYATDPRVRSE
jgi:peptide/nickel transport system permease protein